MQITAFPRLEMRQEEPQEDDELDPEDLEVLEDQDIDDPEDE